MLLAGQDGTRFEMAPIAYQFPLAEDGYDLNWLIIRAKVATTAGHWGGTDPCLLTWELQGLCEWLQAQASDAEGAERDLEFLEPELKFGLVDRVENDVVLRITTRHSLLGLWGTRPPEDERSVSLRVSKDEVSRAAAELALEAKAFPQR